MTKLYLIRHAEAEGNLYRRIHGHYDSLITVNGYRQIEALKERFLNVPIDAAYTSDLARTITTAEALCQAKGLELQLRPELRELGMGIWEDRTWGEVDLEDHRRMRLFTQSSPDWQVEGSETFSLLQERVTAALLDIAGAHPKQTVAIFSHGMAIRYAIAKLLGLTTEETRALGHSDNTGVTLLELDGGKARVVFRDDNSHLSPEISTLARQGWWRRKEGTSPDENLWYEPMEIQQLSNRELYLSSRQEAWTGLGRDLRYLEGQNYLQKALADAEKGAQYLVTANRKNSTLGILQLDPELGAQEGAGHISFYYMLPEYRSSGLGVQLLGHAISVFRPLGRDKLRLACGRDNPDTMRFYFKHGFRKIGERKEPFATLDILEKSIKK